MAKSDFRLVAHDLPVVRGRAAARPHQSEITFGHRSSRFVALATACLLCGTSYAAVFTLGVNVNGSGSVIRNPTNSSYPAGVVVVLTAAPATNWFFAGWSGDATGSTNPLPVMMDTNKTITAAFAPLPIFMLTLATNGAGTISVSPATNSFPSNSTAQLQATPASGWLFANWSGDASGSTNPLTVVMNSNKAVAANFVQPPQITGQPRNAIVLPGETANFSVATAGTAPLTFYWRFNGAPLSQSPQPLLTLTNVQTTQAGNYSVLVSNAYGTAISSNAQLDIIGGCLGSNVVSDCTEAGLRAAIAIGGTVRLCCNGAITLTNTIAITNNVTLDARGRNVVISGNNSARLFNVSTGATVYLTNLFLVNGRSVGTNGAYAGNSPDGLAQNGEPAGGAAIRNAGGTICLVSCVLSNHTAIGGDGGYGLGTNSGGFGGAARGGAVLNIAGRAIIADCIFVQNSTLGGSGNGSSSNGPSMGGALASVGGLMEVTRCSFLRNTAEGKLGNSVSFASGGAVYIEGAEAQFTDSLFASNSATSQNVFLTVASTPPAFGGALSIHSGTVVLNRTRLFTNNASCGYSKLGTTADVFGGAVYNLGTLAVSSSQLSRNQAFSGGTQFYPHAARGGGIYNGGVLRAWNTTLDFNSALGGGASSFSGSNGLGGAIFNAGSFFATNCTIALNTAVGGPPGSFAYASGNTYGGGLFSSGTSVLMNSTVASNNVALGTVFRETANGTAAGGNIASTNGSLTIWNSIIAHGGTNGNGWGTILDGGFNMSSDGSIALNSGSSFSFTDPRLGPLQDNGGPTPTMRLLPFSPAIDFDGATGAPTTDQRGFPRPSGSGVDIGAFEVQPSGPMLNASRGSSNTFTISFVAEAGSTYEIHSSSNFVSWALVESIGPVPAKSVVTRVYSTSGQHQFYRLESPPR